MKIDKVNNIKEISPFFTCDFLDKDLSDDDIIETNRRIEYYKNIVGDTNKYFFGHLHDCTILSLKIRKNNLILKIDDAETYIAAYFLAERIKQRINISKKTFPLEIIAKDLNYISLNTVDEGGTIHKNKFVKLMEYRYEEIIEWKKDNIEIAFDVFGKRYCQYLLLVSCKAIETKEYQRKYWEKYFGRTYDGYYEYFKKEQEKGLDYKDLYDNLKNNIEKFII
jgi:hypothetical protein